ncbi:uncharacterized protein LOC125226380 [Leguminivora glycinivorella]|uniref:uncharacterized protein LOC125226380 n=1 Tax=Leguminivora glycinivorella TaxID=1035111 RepID=UPI00200EEE24|nr:uncharacterized protein LOC125226380 [Leguminivora glycinivorella]
MKVIVVALACLLASVSALPNQQGKELESALRSGDTRLVTGNIVKAIEEFAASIREAGLDPLEIDEVIDYALPVPSILNLSAVLRGFVFRGLSNIVINRMNYAVISSRLTFNIALPEISTSFGLAQWDVNLFDRNFNGIIGGRVSVNNVVITGDIRVSIGIISGVSIRNMEIKLQVGSIQSHLNVAIQGLNLSRNINNYLSVTVPRTLRAYENDINQLITIVARDVVEQNM